MKIKIDKNKCINCATCNVLYEEVFKMNEDGEVFVAEFKDKDIDIEKVKQVAASCPTESIQIIEE